MRRASFFLAASAAILAAVLFVSSRLNVRPLQAGGGAGIVLYTGEGFTGRSVLLEATAVDLPTELDRAGRECNWNDSVRSLVVLGGTWRLYQHGRLNTRLDDTPIEELDIREKLPDEGWSSLVSATSAGPLKVADVRELGIGSDISSVELVSAENLPDWVFRLRCR